MTTADYERNMVLATDTDYKVIGTRPVRHDGADKVTGRAIYGADFDAAGLLHGKILRSPHAHAKIVSMFAPSASTPSTRQEVTIRPSMLTVQAPQFPSLQPSLVPVRPISSLRHSSKLCLGSHRKSTCSPFIVVCTYVFPGI